MQSNYITNETNSRFSTYDLGLAAALITHGFELAEMDRANPKRVLFTFQRSHSELEKTINEYLTDQLRLPARRFFDDVRALKNRLHDAR
ncbi:MAG: DUF5659 domain-containing protein [Candidatus Andersenbacteria bacterium]|nr:DUF5659 domain-containing protein [Candidatus Andersenbacteria bacterium]